MILRVDGPKGARIRRGIVPRIVVGDCKIAKVVHCRIRCHMWLGRSDGGWHGGVRGTVRRLGERHVSTRTRRLR